MGQTVEKPAAFVATVFVGSRVRFRDQVVAADWDVFAWRPVEVERQRVIVKARAVGQHESRQRPEALAHSVELGLGVV